MIFNLIEIIRWGYFQYELESLVEHWGSKVGNILYSSVWLLESWCFYSWFISPKKHEVMCQPGLSKGFRENTLQKKRESKSERWFSEVKDPDRYSELWPHASVNSQSTHIHRHTPSVFLKKAPATMYRDHLGIRFISMMGELVNKGDVLTYTSDSCLLMCCGAPEHPRHKHTLTSLHVWDP